MTVYNTRSTVKPGKHSVLKKLGSTTKVCKDQNSSGKYLLHNSNDELIQKSQELSNEEYERKIHHHNLRPTRCLRGISTRSTYKRSPSPCKDRPFDEALLYPSKNSSLSTNNKELTKKLIGRNIISDMRNKKKSLGNSRSPRFPINLNKEKKNHKSPNSSISTTPNNNRHHHTIHPTRCLRGVSTRATYKRSPSPRKDWPFDEAILYPQSSKNTINHVENKTKSKNKIKNKTKQNSFKGKKSKKSSVSLKVIEDYSSKYFVDKMPLDKSKKLKSHLISNLYSQKAQNIPTNISDSDFIKHDQEKINSKTYNLELKESKKRPYKVIEESTDIKLQSENKNKKVKKKTEIEIEEKSLYDNIYTKNGNSLMDYLETSSIATVEDGNEPFKLSPKAGSHIGWGEKELNTNTWSYNKKCIDEYDSINQTSIFLWNEKYQKLENLQHHMCINDYRLVSFSRDRFNPYINHCWVNVAEYIWQLDKNGHIVKDSINGNSKITSELPALFELLFIKKDSFVGSIVHQVSSLFISHDDIFIEMYNQSLFNFHPNIVRIDEVMQDSIFPYSIFVQEYMPYSCLNWNEKFRYYEPPTLLECLESETMRRVYTETGARIIFGQVLNLVDYLHRIKISGIYLRPESVRISHAFDETYMDPTKRPLTRVIYSSKIPIGHSISKTRRIELKCELKKLWKDAPTIDVSSSSSIEFKTLRDTLYNIKKSIHKVPYNHHLFDYALMTKNTVRKINSSTGEPYVKLSGIFKGIRTKKRYEIFSGNKWVVPPETTALLFNFNQLNGNNSELNHYKCDIWNLGILLHCLLTGEVPLILNNRVCINTNISSPAKTLISQMLHVNPKYRISTSEIFNSSWMSIKNDIL
ncbi:uncharacterized protein CMU_028280 [Cryptosporidium muris RN66]|uniref:Protein kinase domain-containing protein n=1 Tax=Cryptosporidium muris (strain RN66) TaxID=441375 RepID=B6AK58_CRYMR|nr:uncharacterized protein CMU_028280 [Cryptosporidium muris RN66]EEA08599.1 hypothetical protein, conserved [Cryptosporidium muris RN66]|eukprot:XP_002142948.1 hypothetical protein [Cryptosporidium muris RN66]